MTRAARQGQQRDNPKAGQQATVKGQASIDRQKNFGWSLGVIGPVGQHVNEPSADQARQQRQKHQIEQSIALAPLAPSDPGQASEQRTAQDHGVGIDWTGADGEQEWIHGRLISSALMQAWKIHTSYSRF